MSTGLLNSSGTDFEQLFEAGGGNQLLNIYANDGQDIGQKFLNVSEGSQISENTGFLAMDGNDIKTKLCGKGTKKISFTINLLRNGASIYATIDVSGAINGSNVILNGTFTYISHYRSVSTDEDDRDSTGVESHTVKNFVTGNGNSQFFSKSGEYYEGHTSYEWGNKLSSAKPQYKPSFTLSYEGRSFTIPNTAPWASLGSSQWSHSGTF